MDMTATMVQRIDLLMGMHNYIIDMGDEDIYDIWISEGVPDEPEPDDFEFIASNDNEWIEVCELFCELTKEKDNLYKWLLWRM